MNIDSEAALAKFRDAVHQSRLKLTTHARQQMSERDRTHPDGIQAKDVDSAIVTAKRAVYQRDRDTWKVLGGVDLDGDPLDLICALNPERVITVGLG